jgi:flavin reductase (DIM6/NTAB) family NADH-FMN oxidoreductase RutF
MSYQSERFRAAGRASGVTVDPVGLDPQSVYKLLIGSVVPRPIAWVSTTSSSGTRNLAPFSFFTIASCEPPMVSVTFVRRGHLDDAPPKDTLANIRASGEYVVNVVPVALGTSMAISALAHHPDVDEFEMAGLTAVDADLVAAPRVGEAPISMECRVESMLKPGSDVMVIGRILRFHFQEGILGENGRIDVPGLNPLARLAGTYSSIKEPFAISIDADPIGSRPLEKPNDSR